MSGRRVVVTGLGAVSALGLDRKSFWSALCEGRSGIADLDLAPSVLRFSKAAAVPDWNPDRVLLPKLADQTDRFAQFGIAAAAEALSDAGLNNDQCAKRTCGVVTGSSIGGQSTQDAGFVHLYRENRRSLHPLTIPRVMPNAAASQISIAHGLSGPCYAVTAACASSNYAIGQAYWLVKNGQADMMLTGGSEAPLSLGFLKAWDAMRVVSPTTCRPFSANRQGMILGEGGAMLVLEDADMALARGAPIYAEVVGFGMSADAEHLVQPSPGGAARAMRAALAEAKLKASEVDHINAHGSGTTANDASETAALHEVFGDHAKHLTVSATKSMHGHALGAAGALEAVATVLAIHEQIAPPTANYLGPDEACNLDYVPNAARSCKIETALSNAFAFGGLNAVLAFRRWEARS